MDGYFRFKGVDSREMGILISAMPQQTKPKRRGREHKIPGRNGVLTVDEETYEPYTLTMECGVRGNGRLEEITAWLDGSGELILCTEPNRVYRAKIANAIPISDVVYLYPQFQVKFQVFPFKYHVNAFGDTKELIAPTMVLNIGSIYSEPIITVYGSGDIVLVVNGEDFPLYGVDSSITIDSEMMEVYKGTMNQNSKYGAMTFPRLEVGENPIGWTGNVTKVVIIPNWRWL